MTSLKHETLGLNIVTSLWSYNMGWQTVPNIKYRSVWQQTRELYGNLIAKISEQSKIVTTMAMHRLIVNHIVASLLERSFVHVH